MTKIQSTSFFLPPLFSYIFYPFSSTYHTFPFKLSSSQPSHDCLFTWTINLCHAVSFVENCSLYSQYTNYCSVFTILLFSCLLFLSFLSPKFLFFPFSWNICLLIFFFLILIPLSFNNSPRQWFFFLSFSPFPTYFLSPFSSFPSFPPTTGSFFPSQFPLFLAFLHPPLFYSFLFHLPVPVSFPLLSSFTILSSLSSFPSFQDFPPLS